MRILVVNTGSSSTKLSVLEAGATLWEAEPAGDIDLVEAIGGVDGIDAVGHRFVHGGAIFAGPVLLSPEVRAEIGSLASLAPLHQRRALDVAELVSARFSDLPTVACFDTTFFATLPTAAATYALPASWRQRFGLRRFGFHGLSHRHVSRRVGELLGNPPGTRLVSCHLGAGASLAAVIGASPLDTTMGFTPLDGLVMATRSGSIDPGIVLHLLEEGVAASDIAEGLSHESGILGLSGTADMRELVARASDRDETASETLSVYLWRLRREIAAMTAALGGIDAIAFTGGIGEHAPEVRRLAVAGLSFLGLALDDEANGEAHGDDEVTADGATARTFVITAREDLEIAREVEQLLSS